MYLQPKAVLTEAEVQTGLKRVIGDGLAAEAMTTLTGGAFLVAMALLMGASNLQIGLLAALPTFTNIFQLLSIWLVQRYNNRRAIAVICAWLARFPLLVAGSLPLFFSSSASIQLFIFFLFFYYFFGSIAGPSWNSWMKDLVPDKILGTYFAKRSSYTQALNAVLSIILALVVDHIKKKHPEYELTVYAIMFMAAAITGIIGAPLYIICIIAWCFVGIYSTFWHNLALLAGIHILTGISTAGINLSLTNIGLKLATKEEAVVYLSAKNIIPSFFSSIAPLSVGGWRVFLPKGI